MVNKGSVRITGEPGVMAVIVMASQAAAAAGGDDSSQAAVSTATAELARNIVKYAGAGNVTIETVQAGDRVAIRITARDRGPGIDDIDAAMTDHYSTGGTLGLGLPGVNRLMDEFVVESEPGHGTKVTTLKWL